ncbi:MAG: thioredoxin family protein [Bacteroidota bacterium]
MNYFNLSAPEYEKKVLQEKDCAVLVFFNSEEYASNLIYETIIEQLSVFFSGVCTFYRVDTQLEQTLIDKLAIDEVPTVIIYNQGELQDIVVGIYPKYYVKNRIIEAVND